MYPDTAFPGFENGHDVPGVVPLIRIRSSKQRPGDAFIAVRYRNSWFRLMELFTMIDTGSRPNVPVSRSQHTKRKGLRTHSRFFV
jgi:hypothetical protein